MFEISTRSHWSTHGRPWPAGGSLGAINFGVAEFLMSPKKFDCMGD